MGYISREEAEEYPSLYMKKFAPATTTVEQLDHQNLWRRRAIMRKSMTEDEQEQGKRKWMLGSWRDR